MSANNTEEGRRRCIANHNCVAKGKEDDSHGLPSTVATSMPPTIINWFRAPSNPRGEVGEVVVIKVVGVVRVVGIVRSSK